MRLDLRVQAPSPQLIRFNVWHILPESKVVVVDTHITHLCLRCLAVCAENYSGRVWDNEDGWGEDEELGA